MINQVFGAIAALGSAEAQNLLALAGENVLKKYQDSHAWEKLLVNTGEFFLNFEQEATDFFKDLALALSKENMVQIAKDLQTDDGYGLQHKLYDSLMQLMSKYEIPYEIAESYTVRIIYAVLEQLRTINPDKYEHYFLQEWRDEQEKSFQELQTRIDKVSSEIAIYQQNMIHIGESLKQLHSLGYAHRDIKPNNLLYYQGHMYLADFGLVWNAKDTEDHITEVNDHLGPIVIRPPELQLIEDIESVDYRKSDVYLFAKTLWMLLEHDSIGFLSEYSRSDENVYIYKNTEKHKLETAEPLHRLMEGATKHNWGERITIDDCLFYLEEQLSIITETIPQNKLQEYKYIEQVKHIDATFHPDRKEFSDPSAILRTLNEMSGLACLEFNKAGTTTGRILFSKASYIQGGVFEMEIRYPYYYGKKKTIELAIDCIFLDKDLNFEIRSKTYSFEDELFPQYTQIITALESQAKRVRLNAEYSIRMVQL